MPARHTSPGDVSLLEAETNPKGSGRRKRVSARHQVKRLDRPFERVRSSKTGPAEETGFLRSVRISGPQFHRALVPVVKSGPDVFADALVPRPRGVLLFSRRAQRSGFPISSKFACAVRGLVLKAA